MLVPRNHLLVVTAHQRTIIEAIEFEKSPEEKVEETPSDETVVKNEIEETLASEWDIAGHGEQITGEEELREVQSISRSCIGNQHHLTLKRFRVPYRKCSMTRAMK